MADAHGEVAEMTLKQRGKNEKLDLWLAKQRQKDLNFVQPEPSGKAHLKREEKKRRREEKRSLAESADASGAGRDDHSPLPVGEWESLLWTKHESYRGRVLVLWDFDQGAWNDERLTAWLESIEEMVLRCCSVSECMFVGCMNESTTSRSYWQQAIRLQGQDSAAGAWWGRISKLVVTPCVKESADHCLRAIGSAAVRSAERPSALVLVTHDSDFILLLDRARECGVRSVLLRWRKKPWRQEKLLDKAPHELLGAAADVSLVVDKATGAMAIATIGSGGGTSF